MKTLLLVCSLLILVGIIGFGGKLLDYSVVVVSSWFEPGDPDYRVRLQYNLRGDTLYTLTDAGGRDFRDHYGRIYKSDSYAKIDSVRNAWIAQDIFRDSTRWRGERKNGSWYME